MRINVCSNSFCFKILVCGILIYCLYFLSTSKTFLHSGSDVKELNLSWKKLQTGKLKGASSSSTGSKVEILTIRTFFFDFDF